MRVTLHGKSEEHCRKEERWHGNIEKKSWEKE